MATVAVQTGRNLPPGPSVEASGLARRFPEAAFAFVEAPTYRIDGITGHAGLLRGTNLGSDRLARDAAERSWRGRRAVLAEQTGVHAVVVFTPVSVGNALSPASGHATVTGWVVAAFHAESLFQAADSNAGITFQIFDSGPARRRLDGEDSSSKAPAPHLTFIFERRLPAFDRTWLVYQSRSRPLGEALLNPAGLFWLIASAGTAIVWLAGIRRRRSFEVGTRVLDALIDVMLIVDPTGTIVYASPSALRGLGYDPEELSAKRLADIFHEEDREAIQEALAACRLSDEALPIERMRVHAKDGSWRTMSGMSRRIVVGDAVVDFMVSLHDVTNLLGLERQLEAADRVESLGRVAANATHEFRNILMALDTNLQLLQRSAPDHRTASLAEMLRRYVRRGSGIADEILRFAAPTPLHVSAIDARRWLDQMERELRPLLGTKAELAIHVDEPLVFQGDEDRLSQVLTNLILNSRDAIREHGHVSCIASRSEGGNFAFGIVPAGHFAHVEVSDDGEGMGSDTARHIFEPLFTTKSKGTGLGLAISHQIVSAHRGLLFAESAAGKGTSMHIFLPIEIRLPVAA
ncbi:MAG TPA: ATP-binding protein [Thermoanaerobaculia bacterium]|nr:ATP-binding protein [Thermoanaerobaculia bacterium]